MREIRRFCPKTTKNARNSPKFTRKIRDFGLRFGLIKSEKFEDLSRIHSKMREKFAKMPEKREKTEAFSARASARQIMGKNP